MGSTSVIEQPADEVRLELVAGDGPPLQIRAIRPSPCAEACPAGVNVKGYVGLIGARRFDEALALIRKDNPLPGICGRVCHHPCEAHCHRGEVEDPLAIRALKRFVADYALRKPAPPVPDVVSRPERVAIVGSGPAGLTAASDLARMGYGVTIFEAAPRPGGMLTAGIPDFRLPPEIVRSEIQAIEDLGVTIKTHFRIGRDASVDGLIEDRGYAAVFLAIGSQVSRALGIPGETESEDVVDCLTFMRRANAGDPIVPGSRVAVIGGGHSAIDCARTALRLGADDVRVLYRRTSREMPADEEDVAAAETEGVTFTYLVSPVAILNQDDQVIGIRCVRNRLGDPDESGRRHPVPIEGSTFDTDIDTVIPAVGQRPDLIGFTDVAEDHLQTIKADETTLATSRPGVFAGGDAVTGPGTVIDAIAQGHRAAAGIHRFLAGDEAVEEGQERREVRLEMEVPSASPEPRTRAAAVSLPPGERRRTFDEVDLTLTEELAVEEALRCLRCGPCSECPVCVVTCPKGHVLVSMENREEPADFVLRTSSELNGLVGGGKPATLREPGERVDGPAHEQDVRLASTACRIEERFCRACGRCVETCDYGAASLRECEDGVPSAFIDESICRGCGVCVSQCPSGAILQGFMTDADVEARLMTEDVTSRVVVYSCNWNPGIATTGESGDSVWLRVMCAGRVHPGLVLKAFELGAAGVVVLRCGSDHCHYGFGSDTAEQSFDTAAAMIRLLGLDGSRLQQLSIDPSASDARDAVDSAVRSVRNGGRWP